MQNGVGAVNFITGAGGFLQSLIYGYAGIRILPYYMKISPLNSNLPPNTDRLILKGLNYLSTVFDLIITEEEILLNCRYNGFEKIILQTEAEEIIHFTCPDGQKEYVFLKQTLLLKNAVSNLCAPPLDDINVDYNPNQIHF